MNHILSRPVSILVLIVSALGLNAVDAQDLPTPQNATEILRELDRVDQGQNLRRIIAEVPPSLRFRQRPIPVRQPLTST